MQGNRFYKRNLFRNGPTNCICNFLVSLNLFQYKSVPTLSLPKTISAKVQQTNFFVLLPPVDTKFVQRNFSLKMWCDSFVHTCTCLRLQAYYGIMDYILYFIALSRPIFYILFQVVIFYYCWLQIKTTAEMNNWFGFN